MSTQKEHDSKAIRELVAIVAARDATIAAMAETVSDLSDKVDAKDATIAEACAIIGLWVNQKFPFGKHDEIRYARAFLAANSPEKGEHNAPEV